MKKAGALILLSLAGAAYLLISHTDRPLPAGAQVLQDGILITLDDLVYANVFSSDYTTQHPLVCGAGRDIPNWKEMIFSQSGAEESVHAVFPEGVMPPKNLDCRFVLHGQFQGIQNRYFYKFKKPLEDYRYFVVSSWECKS